MRCVAQGGVLAQAASLLPGGRFALALPAELPQNPLRRPEGLHKPFTVTLSESLAADTELIDEFCLEGEKDYERLQRSRGKWSTHDTPTITAARAACAAVTVTSDASHVPVSPPKRAKLNRAKVGKSGFEPRLPK